MPESLTCPSCKAELRIMSATTQPTLTCPRCLAILNNPNAAGGARDSSGSASAEAQRDTQKTSVGMMILAVLGALGLGWWLLLVVRYGTSATLVVWAVLVGFLALVTTGIVWARTRSDPSAMGAGRIVVGTLALAGGFVALGLALFIFLFIVCLVNPPRFHP